jgi:hypothetical protein
LKMDTKGLDPNNIWSLNRTVISETILNAKSSIINEV